MSMNLRFVSILFLSFYMIFSACSSEPCDDLKDRAENCLDNAVKSLLLNVAKKGGKQECTDYLNSYYYTFDSRCSISYPDAESGSDTYND